MVNLMIFSITVAISYFILIVIEWISSQKPNYLLITFISIFIGTVILYVVTLI